jgi:protein-disulfide isomerase
MTTFYRTRGLAAPLCLLAGLACQPKAEQDQTANPEPAAPAVVAAEINGQEITVEELDEFVKDELFSRATSDQQSAKLYEVRSQAIDRMLNNRALEDAAGAEGLTPDEYLTQRMEVRGEISDEEIATFYEEHTDQMSGSSLEDTKDRIAQFLMTQRATELVAELRAQAGAVVHLEPTRIEVDATGPSMGPDDAAVTIIEFSDFQCPYCQRVVPTLHQIMEKYPEQVRVVFRHLPLHRIHARAQAAAEASACADDQGKFWDYHDLVFENNRQLADEDLERYATEAGLEMDDYRQCVADRKFQQEVEADANTAQSLGLSGTPAFFVNGIPLTGALPLDQFVSVIDGELARLTPAAAPAS